MQLRVLQAYLLVSGCAVASCSGATLSIGATTNDGSRFIEHRQDAFWELGRTRESTRVDSPDGAFSYSELPAYVPQGGGGTAFPSQHDFGSLGTIEFDPLTGDITSMEIEFEPYIAPGRFTFFQAVTQASAYETSFNSFSGAVTRDDSGLPSIDLTSEIVFSIDGAASGDGVLTYTGSLNVVDNAFVLAVDDTAFSRVYQSFSGDGNLRMEWSVDGLLLPTLVGDANADGSVDAADYTVWRDHVGIGSVPSPGDVNHDQVVDGADYLVWKANYGAYVGGDPRGPVPVPEPAAGCWLIVTLGLAALGRSSASSPVARRDRCVGLCDTAARAW